MNAKPNILLTLATEADTATLAARLAQAAQAGDCILLEGAVGAGKSCFARAFIRALCGPSEEVPSPTFTLVQVYEVPGVEIWHADLYRLTHSDEVWELGLDEAFQRAICLVEWPDRLGKHRPEGALSLLLKSCGDGRLATISGGSDHLRKALQDD